MLGDPSEPGVPWLGVPTGEPPVGGGESTSVITVVTVKLPEGEASMMVCVTVSGPTVETEVGVLLT